MSVAGLSGTALFYQVAVPGLKWKTAEMLGKRIQLEHSASLLDSVPVELLAVVW